MDGPGDVDEGANDGALIAGTVKGLGEIGAVPSRGLVLVIAAALDAAVTAATKEETERMPTTLKKGTETIARRERRRERRNRAL